VRTAIAAGLEVEECREAPVPESATVSNPAHAVVPDAVRGTFDGLPFILAWTLVRRETA
jgi:hypothetical protein